MNKKAVAYYITSTNDAKARFIFACRLTEKAYQQKLNVYIYVGTQEEVAAIDTQLWTFRDISFIPHGVNVLTKESAPIDLPPVLVGTITPPSFAEYKKDVLINLTQTIPGFHNAFSHLIEIVDHGDEAKLVAEQHRDFYKQQGYEDVAYNL